jgi:oxysterol-binding protein 1
MYHHSDDFFLDSRALLGASYLSMLRSYISSPATATAPEALIKLLQSPRARNVDLNQLDGPSGSALLHEAVRRKDLRLIELAIRSGADVFCRDRRNRGVSDLAGKDDRTKAYLRQFTNHDSTLLEASTAPTQEPSMKGYLTKYGNLAKGYNSRWFVLKDGMLSCKSRFYL